MRISNAQVFTQSLESMIQLRASSAAYQQQISSGKRLVNPSDDPVAAARIVAINEKIGAIEQYARNANAVESNINQQSIVLTDVTNALQRVRDLVLQGRARRRSPVG